MPGSLHLRPWFGGFCHGLQPNSLRAASTTAVPAHTNSHALPPKNRDYLNIKSEALSRHWDTIAPTKQQLKHADKFFSSEPPTFLWSAPKFARMNFGDSPEVCFLGRSNVGKSSLLNAILGRKAMAHVSSKPGRTQSMNAFAVGGDEDNGRNRLVVLDMPGYGKGGRADWGTEIMKYLVQRKQLKRAFLLVDAEHGIKTTDKQILALFRQEKVPHQVILSKVDKVLFPTSRTPSESVLEKRLSELRRTMDEMQSDIQPELEDESFSLAVGELIGFSSEKIVDGKRLGIDAVRHAMLQSAGLELQQKVKLAAPVDIIPHDVWQAG